MQYRFDNKNNGKKGLLTRYIAMAVVVLLLFAGLTGQLASLQLRDGEEYNATAESRKMKTYTLKGERGMILDRNGIPLAYDEESYNVTFYRDPSRSASDDLKNYTQILLRVMEIVERNGGQTVSGFYLKRDEEGNDYLDFLTENEETFAKREKNWRENFYITKVAEEDIFDYLCRRYGIEELDYETQYKVLSIWQELQMNAFLSKPVVIAYDVNMNTVSQIEAASIELTGAAIEQTTKRVYPHGTLAAHIVGYMGSITEDNIEEYVKKGYSADDRVGVYGIEKSMEDQLSGNVSYRQGSQEVEVDANGAVMRELSYKAPVNGNNVVLTIDLEYQQILEESLEYNIEEAKKIQLEALNEATDAQLEKYQQQIANRDGETLRLAATGAAVVLDVHTGEVLAMASYPSFDPNDFVRGMTTEEYNEKYNIDTSPLFNRAISTKATPGSIFKMVTALAGLEEGVVTVDEQIDDESPFTKYDSTSYAPKCWTKYPEKHAGQNVSLALTNSCNYYFYTVADRLGIDNLYKWASLLGLTSKTGIELSGETAGVVGNQSVLYDSSRGITSQKSSKSNYVARTIIKTLRDTGEALGRNFEEERLERVTKQLMDLVLEYDSTEMIEQIRLVLMDELGLSSAEITSRYLLNTLNSYLREIRWTPTETIMTGIGQSITELTPVGVARYTAAIANGGDVLEVQIVDKILSQDGSVVTDKQPSIASHLNDVEDSLEVIRSGMKGVISAEDGGTAAGYFRDYAYTDQVGAKTGTSQVNLIDIENNAWFVAFAPYDDPEIAIVVFIANGYTGGVASLTSKDVITNYMERKNNPEIDTIPAQDSFVP